MTTRIYRCVLPAVVVLLALCVPRDAFAFIGWVERLSGPGHFKGWQIPVESFFCFVDDAALVNLPPPSSATQGGTQSEAEANELLVDALCRTNGGERRGVIKAFLSIEVGHVASEGPEAERRYPDVSWSAIRPVFFYRFSEYVDAGVGIGYNLFKVEGADRDAFLHKWTIPLRVRIAPWPNDTRLRGILRGLYVAGQLDYFLSGLNSEEFRSKPDPEPFDEAHELVPSVFLGVDLARLLPQR